MRNRSALHHIGVVTRQALHHIGVVDMGAHVICFQDLGGVPVPAALGGGPVTASAPALRQAQNPQEPPTKRPPPPAPPALGAHPKAATILHGGVPVPAATGGSPVTASAPALWNAQPPAKLHDARGDCVRVCVSD